MSTHDDAGLQATDADGDEPPDHPPTKTAERIVPVSVPLEIEREARRRAAELDVAIEDAVADHVRVVPAWCVSPAEDGPDDETRRVALHTTVEPTVADLIDDLAAGDRDGWVREAVHEKASRETDGPGLALLNSGP